MMQRRPERASGRMNCSSPRRDRRMRCGGQASGIGHRQNHVTCGPARLSVGVGWDCRCENRAMSLLLETSLGDIVIDLEVEACPKTCENFLKLCKVHYYNLNAFFNGPRYAHFLTIRSV